MKERELRRIATCNLCGRKFGHTGLPLFWTMEIKRHGLNIGAIRRQAGLTELLGGNAAIAAAMGPDEDLSQVLDSVELTVCEECAVEKDLPVAALFERGSSGEVHAGNNVREKSHEKALS